MTSDLYLLSVRGEIDGTSFRYGKNSYYFKEGTLVFLVLNQVVSFTNPMEELYDSGWRILCHSDLI